MKEIIKEIFNLDTLEATQKLGIPTSLSMKTMTYSRNLYLEVG